MSDESTLRTQLQASYANRAMVYLDVYRVLEEEFGEQRAAGLMKKAIYRRGCAVGEQYRCFGPADLEGLKRAFLGSLPDDGRLFEPEVVSSDGNVLEIHLHRCPLKEAWQQAGLSDADVERMCAIAGVVDNGTFETAGFRLRSETWRAGQSGCCHLTIQKGD